MHILGVIWDAHSRGSRLYTSRFEHSSYKEVFMVSLLRTVLMAFGSRDLLLRSLLGRSGFGSLRVSTTRRWQSALKNCGSTLGQLCVPTR